MKRNDEIIYIANAAHSLGEFFAPPKGTIILLHTEWRRIRCRRIVTGETDWKGFGVRPINSYSLIWVTAPDTFEIVSLPDNCPPFLEWLRPYGRHL